MIRRAVSDPILGPSWILVSQVAHARLAAQAARAWNTLLVEPPDVQAELLDTIEHHDDGWDEWEKSPRVDSDSGRPFQFTEMPLDQSLVIWQRSIDACRTLGDLAPWLVAGHFAGLLRHSNSWQKSEHPQSSLAREFLARQDADRLRWQRIWQATNPAAHALSVAERCLRWLQFFDAFSLWLCCAERSQKDKIQGVDPAHLTLYPKDLQTIAVAPWPFATDELCLTLRGRQIPANRYTDSDVFDQIGNAVELCWRLVCG